MTRRWRLGTLRAGSTSSASTASDPGPALSGPARQGPPRPGPARPVMPAAEGPLVPGPLPVACAAAPAAVLPYSSRPGPVPGQGMTGTGPFVAQQARAQLYMSVMSGCTEARCGPSSSSVGRGGAGLVRWLFVVTVFVLPNPSLIQPPQ